jgi:hypothetical protein
VASTPLARDRMFWLLSPPKVLKELEPHPSKHHLRVFAGQPDPRDSSRFWFDYTIDGKLGRTFIRIRDPGPTSSNPTQARVERESSRSFTGG